MTGEARWRELKQFVRSKGWQSKPGKSIQYGEQIVVTTERHRATVTFYPKRGKIVPGGPNSSLRAQLQAWIQGERQPSIQAARAKPDPQPISAKETRLDTLKKFIREQGWNWEPGADIPYGEQIVVSDAGTTAIVNVWPQKGTIQVQGKASPLKKALQSWVDTKAGSAPSTGGKVIDSPHIGMDESGKGDWYGPLVVAAVYLDESMILILRQTGVRDSKDLSPDAIQRLAGVIERTVPANQRYVWAIKPETYNQLYPKHGNINLLLADAYAKVAEKVWRNTQANTIVCDQFSQRADRLENSFADHGLPDPVQQHKAESLSIAVAAASILASAEFTLALERLGHRAELGKPLPKGASNLKALKGAAHRIIETYGEEALERYAKLNFKPVRALLNQTTTKTVSTDRPGAEAQQGEPVTIRGERWQVQYHPSGFWRYTFSDGGYLDWWENSAKGTIYVHGKSDAESVRILKPKTEGKSWHGEREGVDEAIQRYIPRFGKQEVPTILGVGWHCQETVLGARFDFTDGSVLNYYRGKDTLSLQGTPSPLTKETLEALPSPFWGGLEELKDTLKTLFPDWRIGKPEHPQEPQGEVMSAERWSPLEKALDWQILWPDAYEKRQAADKKSPCQRALIEDWASILKHHQKKHHLLVHAPTGLGKTLAALVPALAWVAEKPDQRRIYYLVNRVTQHENPLRELRNNLATQFEEEARQQLKVVDLVGRDRLCTHPKAQPLSDSCRQSRDTASFDLLPTEVSSWHEVKESLPAHICPYHTLRGLMKQAHVIICDYWWLFSPLTQESGLLKQVGFSPQDSIVIVDEAHNLVSRVRSWLDVDEPMKHVAKTLEHAPSSVKRCLQPVLDTLGSAKLNQGFDLSVLLARAGGVDNVQAALSDLAVEEMAEEQATIPERILRLLLYPDETVVVYPTEDFQTGKRRMVFRLVDPTSLLQEGYNHVYASLSMSGTLAAPADGENELQYQIPIFGLSLRETLARKYASPFPLRNQRWIYCTDTLGTYRKRGDYIDRYAEHIASVGQVTPGVTAVFFSSYVFLEQVREAIVSPNEQALITTETRADALNADVASGDVRQYEQRLRSTVKHHGRGYLFAVYQGKLAEGADFQDNLIKTVICVSIPMEYPVLFHERLEALYAKRFSKIAEELRDNPEVKAHEYALDRYSLSLVLQACGRGIRRKADRCMFLMLDERYHDFDWRRFLAPRPYNVQRPEINLHSSHQEYSSNHGQAWDPAVMGFGGAGGKP